MYTQPSRSSDVSDSDCDSDGSEWHYEDDESGSDSSDNTDSDAESDSQSTIFPVCNNPPRKPKVLPVNSKTGSQSKPTSKYKKPKRMCPFCKKYFQEKLTRHVQLVHKKVKEVSNAMNLPKNERDAAFDFLKKKGILEANQEQMRMSTPVYQRERKTSNDSKLVLCGLCNGFYSKMYFKKHKYRCQGDSNSTACSIPLSLMTPNDDISEDFRRDILCKFRDTEVGDICRTDPVVLSIGKQLWRKGMNKKDKVTEVKKSVMSDMRRLASLYLVYKDQDAALANNQENSTVAEMFKREHFNVLSEAIQDYTTQAVSSGIKSGLKTALYYLIKKACKIIKSIHLMERQDESAAEIDRFISVFELNHEFIFGDAIYHINYRRQKSLRKPIELPIEDDVVKLRQHTINKVSRMVTDDFMVWDSRNFIMLRDLTVSRLTVFNARRGGEPSRLKLFEWQEAEDNQWIDTQRAEDMQDPIEKKLLSHLRVSYQTGKGNNHLVPILFPPDTIEAMRKLTSQEVRTSAGVKEDNLYVFPCVQGSSTHVTGWHALKNICSEAGIEGSARLTATKNRHRVSTLYAAMELPEHDRELFFRHMGHSSLVNQNIYQVPPAIAEVVQVGKQLMQIDERE